MNIRNYKIILIVLALLGVFSSVSTVTLFAGDTVKITNSVSTSNNTGGQTVSNGQAGQSGKAGQAGTSGTDGQDGKSGQTGQAGANGSDGQSGMDGKNIVNGKSTASISVESSINGQTVFKEQKTIVSEDGSPIDISYENFTATSSVLLPEEASSTSSEVYVEKSSFPGLQETFLSIRLTILKYVSLLF